MAENLIPLNTLVRLEDISESLGTLQAPIDNLLSEVFILDLQSTVSDSNSNTYYSCTIVSFKRLALELPGTNGIALVLNAGAQQTGRSEFPVSLSFSWGVLRYIPKFDLDSFDYSPRAIFDLLLEVSGASNEPRSILENVILLLIPSDDEDCDGHDCEPQSADVIVVDPFEKFVESFNSQYNPSTPLTITPGETVADDLISQMNANGNTFDVFEVIFNDYLFSTDAEEALRKIYLLFSSFLGSMDLDKLKSMLIPHISATAHSINLALQFPRSILKPLDPVTGEVIQDEDIKSQLVFNVGSLYFSTRSGFDFDLLSQFSFAKSQIGDTGLTLEFSNAVIDLSETHNILQADIDNRPKSFKGVFIETATIGLPPGWSANSGQAASIIGRNLLIGSPGGISGTIGLEGGNLNTTLPGGIGLALSTFSVTFEQNVITGSAVTGTLTVNGQTFNLTGSFTNDGFVLTAASTVTDGVKVIDSTVLDAYVKELTIGKNAAGKFFIAFAGKFDFDVNLPALEKFIPDPITINEFQITHHGDIEAFDVKLEWPALNGLTLQATDGNLDVTIPVNKTILNTLTIKTIRANLNNTAVTDGARAMFLMDGSVVLGPMTGVVEGVGVQADLKYVASGGNVGPLQIDNVSFVKPSGIGLSIDTQGFKGGGFLSYNDTKKEYAGALELTFNKFSLKAIGILTTQLPGGEKGFSLLILINVEFSPAIQLGYGFTLSGAGGLLGLHRTTKLEILRLGLKNGTVDNILFPENVIQNAPQIISDLNNVFPIEKGRFVFGPMGVIGWGAPTLIRLEAGIIIEVPDPVRVAILGVIRAVLPDKDNDLIRLQISFLGTVDFAKKFITFDASIFDSKLLTYSLSGDMAFRLLYGDNPAFLLTVGGFHPAFNPPPLGLPSLTRLTIKILDKDKAKITLTAYFALTSNTVQVGARIDIYAEKAGFNLTGYLGFDALFQFSPFYFTVSIGAMLALKKGSTSLFAVYLDFNLEGPTPWRARGKAEFEFLKLKKSVSFDETFGEHKNVTYPDINILPLLQSALQENENWEAVIDKEKNKLTVIKNINSPGSIVMDPFGTLSINQKVVPLKLRIEKFGNRRPQGGPQTFRISKVTIGGTNYSGSALQDLKNYFAPAEYKNIAESGRLSGPSFELHSSGVKAQAAGGFDFKHSVRRPIQFESIIIDSIPGNTADATLTDAIAYWNNSLRSTDRNRVVNTASATANAMFNAHVRAGAAANSTLSASRTPKNGIYNQRVAVKQERFAVVNKTNLALHADSIESSVVAPTLSEARDILERIIARDPSLTGQIQVVPEYEVKPSSLSELEIASEPVLIL